MGKLPNFPHELKFGGSVVRILRDPLRIPLKKTGKASAGKSKGPRQAHKTYDSFLVVYFVGPKPVRVRRSTYEKALAKANEVGVQLLNNDIESLKLSGADRRAYLIALENLKGLDKSLDHVSKEYADAAKLLQPTGAALSVAVAQYADAIAQLKGVSLPAAVEFFKQHGSGVTERKTVPEIVTELLKSMESDGLGKYHIRDTKRRLDRFSADFAGQILNVKESEIDAWLRELRALPGRRKTDKTEPLPLLEPRTRNHYRNSINLLFNFARQMRYLPRDLSTAAQGTKLVKVVRGENAIFAPEEMEMLLRNAPVHIIPGMALKAFSGVRLEEITEIDWKHILFDQNCIKITAEIAKLTQRRLIHLHPNLKAWLEPFRRSGRLCDRWTTPQSVFQAWQRYAARKKFKFAIGENKFRNSFISYRVAETNDIALVAMESGNSPKTIQREYLEIATPQEAAKWFGIFPKNTPRKKKA